MTIDFCPLADENQRVGTEDADPALFFKLTFSSTKNWIQNRRNGALTPEAEELICHLWMHMILAEEGDAETPLRTKLQAFRLWFLCAPERESESLSCFLPGCHMISGHQISGSGRTRFPLFSSSQRWMFGDESGVWSVSRSGEPLLIHVARD